MNTNKNLSPRPPKVLAISSGGGHWVQLLRLMPAFEGCRLIFATVDEGYRHDVNGAEFSVIPDSNRWHKAALVRTGMAVLRLLLRERPDVVVSTGAAPGYLAVRLGSLLGARTAWIDSVANASELSLSGLKAGSCADLWLTQWPHLAKADRKGPRFVGNVLG
jgi:UDP-N-acetylglucosamine:LPS N-acetylglucosamine transferase